MCTCPAWLSLLRLLLLHLEFSTGLAVRTSYETHIWDGMLWGQRVKIKKSMIVYWVDHHGIMQAISIGNWTIEESVRAKLRARLDQEFKRLKDCMTMKD